jgi:hypothetical protein
MLADQRLHLAALGENSGCSSTAPFGSAVSTNGLACGCAGCCSQCLAHRVEMDRQLSTPAEAAASLSRSYQLQQMPSLQLCEEANSMQVLTCRTARYTLPVPPTSHALQSCHTRVHGNARCYRIDSFRWQAWIVAGVVWQGC